MANRLGWVPDEGGGRSQGQWFSWDKAALRAKWDSAQVLCAKVAATRADFEGLAAGLSTAALAAQPARAKPERGAASCTQRRSVWHEEHAHSNFQVSDLCVRCGEAVKNLEHIVHHCPHWHKERREPGLPAHAQQPIAGSCATSPAFMGCCRRLRRCLCLRMSLPWFCGRVWTPSGRMGQVVTAVTLTSAANAGLAM
eukprot:1996721-Amphidinium_carterae.2